MSEERLYLKETLEGVRLWEEFGWCLVEFELELELLQQKVRMR